jgi:hypothetical protein
MLSKKNKNISNLRYKSYDFENTNHIALSDFIRIQNTISPVNTEKEERQAYEERLRLLSKNKSTKWNDSLEKKKKMEYEKAKCRFLEEEERRRKIDEQELKYFEARENMVIQKAKEQFFNEQDAVKSFNSKLLLCDMLKERDFQKEIKERKKEINNIIEKQFFDMEKKSMEELDKKEIEKKKIEEEKRIKRMNMLNDQLNDMKMKIVRDYQEKLIEGKIMKMNMEKALQEEIKEKELREKKLKDQLQFYKEENLKLAKEKEKIKMKELEEEKKIEEFAKKKEELNTLRRKNEEEKMKKKLEQRQKLIDKQFEYLQNLQKKQNEIIEKHIQTSNDKKIEENRIKKEKLDKMLNDMNESREIAVKKREEEKKKNREEDIQYLNDYKLRMEKLNEEENKEKEMKRLKERELKEYQKLQYEEKKRRVMDDFARLNEDAYKNMQRLDNENDDFIKYAEYHIQEYKKQGKNIRPLLIELKKYKQKYCKQ